MNYRSYEGARRRTRAHAAQLARLATAAGAAGLLVGTFAAQASAAPVSSSAAATGTLYVSTTGVDGGTCRLKADPCATVTYAATLAVSGATIDVAAGTYNEQVAIPATANLSVVGAGAAKTVFAPDAVPATYIATDGQDAVDPIIDIAPGATANLKNLGVSGSNAAGSFTACGVNFAGLYYQDASGTAATVKVSGVALPNASSCGADGDGIIVASDAGSSSTVSLSYGTVSGYQSAGIVVKDAGSSVTVDHAKVSGTVVAGGAAQAGISGTSAGSLTVTNSSSVGNRDDSASSAGILLLDNTAVTLTSDNTSSDDRGVYASYDGSAPTGTTLKVGFGTVSKSTSDGIDVVGLVSGQGTATVNNDTVTSDPGYGVGVENSAAVTIDNVVASKDGNGIFVGNGSTGGNVYGNTVNNNTTDGILADSSTSSNTFRSNQATNDKSFDYADASTGGGTAGTANSWTSNACSPAADSSPEGLC